jgi:hypothetical protein
MDVSARGLGEWLQVSRDQRGAVGPTEGDHRQIARRRGGQRHAHQSGAPPSDAALHQLGRRHQSSLSPLAISSASPVSRTISSPPPTRSPQ